MSDHGSVAHDTSAGRVSALPVRSQAAPRDLIEALQASLQAESTPRARPTAFVTARELAEHLGVPVGWVYAATADGRLPHLRAGRHLRYRVDDVELALTRPATRRVDG